MPNGSNGRQRGSWSKFTLGALIAGVLLICHLLSVVIVSAQSTAAGGPLVLFPLALIWQGGLNSLRPHPFELDLDELEVRHSFLES